MCFFFFFQAEDGIRDLVRSSGLGDVYKRQHVSMHSAWQQALLLGLSVPCIDIPASGIEYDEEGHPEGDTTHDAFPAPAMSAADVTHGRRRIKRYLVDTRSPNDLIGENCIPKGATR